MDTLSVLLGSFQIHLPYSYVAQDLLEAEDNARSVDNAALLDTITKSIGRRAKGNPGIKTLALVMGHINNSIKDRMMHDGDNTT